MLRAVGEIVHDGRQEDISVGEAAERNVQEATCGYQGVYPGTSRTGIRFIVRSDLEEMFKPLAESVARKLVQLKARTKGIEDYDKLIKELRTMEDKERELAIIEKLEAWGSELGKLNAPLAFEGKQDKEQVMNVARYQDEWVNTGTGALRAWYVCRQDFHGGYECGTLVSPKQWMRKLKSAFQGRGGTVSAVRHV